jgi:hypothetical protein
MLAVLNTSSACAWAEPFGDLPWPLLPVSNRPLLDYWLETCSEAGIAAVQLVLGGDDAKQIEDFVHDGKRWNLKIQYTFARPGESAENYLKSIAALWGEGLFYLGNPMFLRRRQAYRPAEFRRLDSCRYDFHNEIYFLYGPTGADVQALLDGQPGSKLGLEQIHVHPFAIGSTASYFDLNMKMVRGEFSRYVTAGFSAKDGSSIGYNVRTPPSSQLEPPIMVGDDCRFGTLTSVGPNAIVGNHVIVDSHSELADCLILNDTYIGRNLEIRKKIVAGNRVIDPSDGEMIQIEDSWLIARNRAEMRTEDLFRIFVLWIITCGLVLVQLVPFLVLCPIVLVFRAGRFTRQQFHDPRTGFIFLPVFGKTTTRKSVVYRLFRALSLDRFPRLLLVLGGRLFLCGQPPMRHPDDDAIIKQLRNYLPGVFCYEDYNKDSDRLTDSLWYAHIRSLFEDVKILIKALLTRFLTAGRQ